ncbi:Hint domain-containing protein [Pseudosulfitobacter sp. SM2401]|uniref:Hint domain-containing protein n=1 Tax=Pseudosulfitobacter sp. SM2401 TaxID=3350098 RepID=UPI0036F20DE5
MATYTVTTSNWNDPAFWAAISQSGPGHTLDFSALPSNFDVDFWPDGDRIVIGNGTSNFTIGDSDNGGSSDAQMGGTTQLEYFTTVISSQGNDMNDGGSNSDTLIGEGGQDTLSGNGGNDYIEGGDGNDRLSGGSGDDTLHGGSGDDTLYGGDGDDYMVGGAGNDTLYGGYGNDSISGGDGHDLIQGEQGNDTIDGGAGDDTIRFTDSSGVDQIDGSSGDDALVFVSGTPVLITFNGLENGTYAYDGGGGASGTFSDIEHFEGGSGKDTLDFSNLPDGVTVTYTGNGAGSITDGTQTITFNNIENMVLTEHDDSVDASASWNGVGGDNVGEDIDAGGGNDTIIGGNGGDTLEGGSGNDYIDGDYGDDALSGGDGNDTIIGGRGNDTITGGGGDDSLDGGLESDTLIGGDGNDTIDGGDGDDSIEGGAGNDVFAYSVGDGNDTITDFNSGNTGTLSDGDATNNDSIDLSGYYDHLSELYADQADDGVLNQSNDGLDGVDYSDNDQFGSGSLTIQGASADNSSFTEENTGVTCFTNGTAIQTPRGDILIENLRIGDLVYTADNGAQPIRWIGTRTVGRQALQNSENLRPVLIKAGVLGNIRPLLVSQQHGMVVGDTNLVRAKHLATTMTGVRIAHGKTSVTYVHLMFDAHQIIFAEGIPSESFYPGPMGLKMIGSEVCEELFSIFPNLRPNVTGRPCPINEYGETARIFVAKKDLLRSLIAA